MPKATVDDVRRAFAHRARLQAEAHALRARRDPAEGRRAACASRTDEISDLITAESGLCKKDSLYEVGRACDVFVFAANEALKDDGQVFSCDLTPHGKKRKVYTLREPLLGVISAITPFNHPLNQVAHKIAPSIATNNRMVLKPTEKTPLSALLPRRHPVRGRPAAADVVGGHRRPARDRRRADHQRARRPRHVHRRRADRQVHRRQGRLPAQVLELGGNDPIIVMEDADLEEAATLAAQGSYKNSGQRCTAVKRMLVHEASPTLRRAAGREDAAPGRYGDPMRPASSTWARSSTRPRRSCSRRG